MRTKQHFFRVALSDFNVGALAASSRYLIREALRSQDGKHLKKVIEYGPGNGVMTKALLKRLPPDGQLIVIESNRDFVGLLREIGDPRLRIIHGEIQNIIPTLQREGLQDIDLIVSSIPFSWLNQEARKQVIADSVTLLAKGGGLVFFHQYIPLAALSLRGFFEKVSISFVLRNIFPCFVVVAHQSTAKNTAPHFQLQK